jgi:hypothetical protein
LGSGETLLAIDFRPATGQLYGVSSASRLYVINQNTGTARAIGAGAFTPAVAGNLVGFDFNPTVDRIRLVTSTGQNLRLNPETGTVAATDGVLNGAAGVTITGAAYTNNVAGAETTVLYDLDPATDRLYRQDPPNNGTLVAVGNLNLNITGDGGFDIDAKTGTALGLYSVQGKPTLFSVNLSTGAARPLAEYNASAAYSGLAIPTQPVAYSHLNDELRIFNPTDSSPIVRKKVAGLGAGEYLAALDFRPATGQLYALVLNVDNLRNPVPRLYTINLGTGQLTLVGSLGIGLRLGDADIDFDPVTDQIRLITKEYENLRIDPTTGRATAETSLSRTGSVIPSGIAFDTNVVGTGTSTLYVLGAGGMLYRADSPNAGVLTAIGRLMEPVSGRILNIAGFDIGSTSNTAYTIINPVIVNIENPTNPPVFLTGQVATINLVTGRATVVRELDDSFSSGFTVGPGF